MAEKVNYIPKNAALLNASQVIKDGVKQERVFILPMGRTLFVAAHEPFVSRDRKARNIKNGKPEDDGATRSLSYVTPREANWDIVREEASAMAKAAFGTDKVKMPWVRAEDKLEADQMGVDSLEGFYRFTANTYSEIPVVNARGEKVTLTGGVNDPLYNGCFVRPEVKLATFDVTDENGNKAKGIKFYLRAIQIIKTGPKLGEQGSDGQAFGAIDEEDDAAMDEAFA